MMRSTWAWGLVVTVPLLLVLLACETPIGPFRATTFPPDLSYLPPAQIRTAMWVLAAEIKELEALLSAQEEGGGRSQQYATRAVLERMRVAAQSLDQPGRSSQHPVLNENLELFLNRIERAKRALDRDPPDYYLASTIAGSCYLCHGQSEGVAMTTPHQNARAEPIAFSPAGGKDSDR